MTLMVTQLNQNSQQEHVQRGSVMASQLNNRVFSLRNGEGEQPMTFRVERLFSSNHRWYFNTREAVDQGPFNSRDSALRAIKRYIKDITVVESSNT